jgi:hypothetical protein
MEKVTKVAHVEQVPTRSGNTRFVVRDADGEEYSTFRPQIGQAAAAFEGRRARIEYHEEERNGFRNVYLDAIEPADEAPAEGAPHDDSADEAAWQAAVEAAPWLLGTDRPKEEVPPDELFDKLRPFKERVAEDIEQGDAAGDAEPERGEAERGEDGG